MNLAYISRVCWPQAFPRRAGGPGRGCHQDTGMVTGI